MERLRPPQLVASFFPEAPSDAEKKLASRSPLEGWITRQRNFVNLPPNAWN
jgi:hypothetical protein